MERGKADGELSQLSVGKVLGVGQSYEDLVARYGEDNAKYLWSELGDLRKNYHKFTYIDDGARDRMRDSASGSRGNRSARMGIRETERKHRDVREIGEWNLGRKGISGGASGKTGGGGLRRRVDHH